jgi:branched-chain amino acid transport system permease protein
MDPSVALILLQDGVVNGAIYALLALALVLVFAVTRVILIPQGEFVAFGALTYAALDTGRLPGSVWLLCGLGVGALAAGLREARTRSARAGALGLLVAETLGLPAGVLTLTMWLAPRQPGPAIEALLAIAIVAPMAPYLYRIAFAPLGDAPVLVLLIAAVGVHLALVGLGLLIFGPEGSRATPFSDATLVAGGLPVPAQAVCILGASVVIMAALAALFGLTLTGKAMRATAMNRLGARLVGIPVAATGRLAFALAGAIGALSGVLIVPLTTIYYDSGFLIGLKGFVGAIAGGLAIYPAAAAAALGVGIAEAFAAFWASAFKEVIVFALIIPALLALSFRHRVGVDGE